jgi:hypothetical protein
MSRQGFFTEYVPPATSVRPLRTSFVIKEARANVPLPFPFPPPVVSSVAFTSHTFGKKTSPPYKRRVLLEEKKQPRAAAAVVCTQPSFALTAYTHTHTDASPLRAPPFPFPFPSNHRRPARGPSLRRPVDEAAMESKLKELRAAMAKEKSAREGVRGMMAAGEGTMWQSSRPQALRVRNGNRKLRELSAEELEQIQRAKVGGCTS